jgi:hypothetical protein
MPTPITTSPTTTSASSTTVAEPTSASRIHIPRSVTPDGSCAPAPGRRPLKLGEEVETGMGGGLDPSPTPTPQQVSESHPALSVADLQHALRMAKTAQGTHGHRPTTAVALPQDPTTTRWLAVLAAHSGAGASTIALALAEAATDDQTHAVHLVECAAPTRSGLAGAAVTELGIDATGLWRQGQRDRLMLHRRVTPPHANPDQYPGGETPSGWPTRLTAHSDPSTDARPLLVILDLSGAPWDLDLTRAAAVLVAFRATVPGIRATETLLAKLDHDGQTGQAIAAAALGPRHWPTPVTAAAGPGLVGLRDRDRIVTVPTDRHLAISGATTGPLPKPLLTASRTLLSLLLPAAQPDTVFDDRLPTDHAAGGNPQDGERTNDALAGTDLFGFATELVR